MNKIRQGVCSENFSFLAWKMAKLAFLVLHSGQKMVKIHFDKIWNFGATCVSKMTFFQKNYLIKVLSFVILSKTWLKKKIVWATFFKWFWHQFLKILKVYIAI